MLNSKRKKIVFWTLVVSCSASLIFVAAEWALHVKNRNQMITAAHGRARDECVRAAGKIDTSLKQAEMMVQTLSGEVGDGKLSNEQILEKLEKIVRDDSAVLEIGVAYEPYAYDEKIRLHAPHYGVKDDKPQFYELEEQYDYTQQDWYKDVIAKGPQWIDPCYGAVSKKLGMGYAAPVYQIDNAGQKKAVGVVRVDFSLQKTRELAASLELGKAGYSFAFSKKGTMIYHPSRKLVEEQKNILDIAKERKGKGSEQLIEAAKKAMRGENPTLHLVSPQSGKGYEVYYQCIPSSGATLAAVFLDDDIFTSEKDFRRQKILIALGLIAFFTLLSVLLLRATGLGKASFWIDVTVFSGLCMAGTCYVWYLALNAPVEMREDNVAFTDAISVSKFIEKCTKASEPLHKKPPVFIPTGLYVQTLAFVGSNDLDVSGYVWQKYTGGVHDGVSRGFVFPEARQIRELKEVYRLSQDNQEVIGWYFEATVRESIDYSKYPFDRPAIWIWLRHKDFFNDVVLIPDLDAYKFITPIARPGLQRGLVLPGYSFQGAYFSCEEKFANTNFGITANTREEKFPEFYYNVMVKRNFLTPFISKIFPLITILAMIFIVLLMFSKDEVRAKTFGISGLAVLGSVVSFFFATLLSQVSLKQELSADKIIFLENFHFIIYAVLFLTALKAFLFMGNKRVPFVQYDHGLIPKLLYWPVISVTLLVISLFSFY